MQIKCKCTADKYGNKQAAQFQDKTYGNQIRIANPKLGNKIATCTVCGTIHIAGLIPGLLDRDAGGKSPAGQERRQAETIAKRAPPKN